MENVKLCMIASIKNLGDEYHCPQFSLYVNGDAVDVDIEVAKKLSEEHKGAFLFGDAARDYIRKRKEDQLKSGIRVTSISAKARK